MIWVPLTTLRYIERYSHLTDPRVVERYLNDQMRIYIWRDYVIEGSRVVSALMRTNPDQLVRVHLCENYPIHGYPGDL